MQNERLFDRIRHAALTETAGTDEYDPEKLWANIRNKDNRKTRMLWWPYAAASVVLILIFLVKLPEKQQKIHVANNRPRLATPEQNPPENIEKKIDRLVIPPKLPASNIITNRRDIPEQRLSKTTEEPASIDTDIPDLQITKSETAENQTTVSSESTITPLNDKLHLQQKKEKVLVANIALPENKTDQQSGLQRIFEQVKKDREARRMRLQFNRNVGKPTLWSFVHQSFVENRSATQKPRQPDTNHH
jgi:hypothetical protein